MQRLQVHIQTRAVRERFEWNAQVRRNRDFALYRLRRLRTSARLGHDAHLNWDESRAQHRETGSARIKNKRCNSVGVCDAWDSIPLWKKAKEPRTMLPNFRAHDWRSGIRAQHSELDGLRDTSHGKQCSDRPNPSAASSNG
jgi:hypothetical protein